MSQYTAITPQQFAKKAWLRNTSYTFAADSEVIPVVVAELANLVPALPLGFVKTNDSFQLTAITALQPRTNLFVGPNGAWLGRYIPAALRAHPFRVVKVEGQNDGVLCINEESGLVVDAGCGEAFFDDAGAPSQALKDMLSFMSHVEINRGVTQVAVNALQTAGVIQPWPLQVQNGAKAIPVEGVYCIDEAKLNALSDDEYLALRSTGSLPLAFAQLLSMNQLPMLDMAADMQKRFRAQASSQAQKFDGLEGFKFSGNDILKFS